MTRKNIVVFILSGSIMLFLLLLACARKDDYTQGLDALEKGDYENALKSLKHAYINDTLNPDIHLNLSLAYAHLDSMNKSFHHFLWCAQMDSVLCDNIELKEIYSQFLNIEPYRSTRVNMRITNQFKGVFSPDEKSIVVAAATRDNPHIYLISLDGSIIKKITKSGMNTDPDISPDGKHIIFVSNVDGDEDIYLYNMETDAVEQLTHNTAQDFSPSFSPNGKEAVFISNMDDQYKWEIYTINLESKEIKHITKNQYWDGFPKFSSDGKSIVFSSKRNGSENVFIMKAGGGGEKELYKSAADDNDPLLMEDNLYFKSNREGEWEIYRYNLKNEHLLRLTYNKSPDWNPRISYDGSKLLVSRRIRNNWKLYWIDLTQPTATDELKRIIEKKLEIGTISGAP
jgi:Tol biopolymer transport system component